MSDRRVLMVIPTLGRRPEYLEQAISSIEQQGIAVSIVLVAPLDNPHVQELAVRHGAQVVPDPGSLPAAVNAGASHGLDQQPPCAYVNWLGDDDLLEPGSLARTVAALEADPTAVLAFGACRYIDGNGQELWISKAGPWAPRILKWGPDLIPQPGMLVRATAWSAVGGVDDSLKFAFDLDLLLKLQPLGRFVDVGEVVSSFRWHADSLTVGDRTQSLQESERARRRALSPFARKCAWMWEGPVRIATRLAANEVSRRARKISSGRSRRAGS